jgi:hypothetical protein
MWKCVIRAFALSSLLGFGVAFAASLSGVGSAQAWAVWIPGFVCGVIAFGALLMACRRGEVIAEDFPQMFRNLWDQFGWW